jgi:hypothetical protein
VSPKQDITFHIKDKDNLNDCINAIIQAYEDNGYIAVKIGFDEKTRTLTQNAAMHKYFELLANELNAGGFTVQKVVTKPLDISWSKHLVKEVLWRQVQEALFGKESTARLIKAEVSQVYQEVDRCVSSLTGVHVEFPSRERW